VSVHVSDLPSQARGELIALSVPVHAAVELKDGWNIAVAEANLGSAVGLLVRHGARINSIDPSS